ncbi:hypothetical protein [Lactiplantibacillus mudanjiangensis]|uniref:Uncharacterized protein n=1 Tax=Lactiplantibacillus mudanjiangensis TaxID=1296538 RepID=A0A660E453_9LACO|nr:hypothetical protein [Lactiplantibacillus mudanjiangensis]VDG18580.1 hypothetical protein MUDAN_BIHEEGNE_03420 [Lactiplantibacillus mudanjiangensis]VDG24200.1 hypothetical protein MUDAN_IGPPGNFN_02469 [Lactiplantibacillus mudanjiangensis]VDG30178.1 hypothetical protein MUDAN_MDHGFNIF_01731 [Lactiplantibacillus mudanjiangensis]
MRITGARINEQGVNFSIVVVNPGTLNSPSRDSAANDLPLDFPRPVILAEQSSNGGFQFYGRDDIVDFLASLDPSQIPWEDYEIS